MPHRSLRHALLLALALGVATAAGAQVAEMAPEDLEARIAAGTAPLVLELRTAEEFAAGHIPGAMNISHDELAERLEELDIDLDETVVVYCRSGRRAGVAEELLGKAGYTKIMDLTGHWLGWQEAGRPIE